MSQLVARDADGNEISLIFSRDGRTWSDSSGGGRSLGRISIETEDGRGVDRISKGVYDIIDPLCDRIRVTSDDPAAP